MTDESTLNQGGSEALPDDKTNVPAPKSDAEAALQAKESAPQETAEQKAEREKGDRAKNRTKEYIDRINRERAELAAENARLRASQGSNQTTTKATESDNEPSLEDFDYDVAAFNKAHAKWAVADAMRQQTETTKQADEAGKQQEITAKYEERLAAFAEDHPDFQVVIGSIPYQLSPALQAAIMAHERGPDIAYHLGNNDDDAFAMASLQPNLAAAAVDRLAKRLTAAPAAEQGNTGDAPSAPANPKPISKAPAPTPTLSGRTPTETPSEKMTDDEWFKRRQQGRKG